MGYELYRPEWGKDRPIRGVLFDMDGLVLDSEILYSRFWREACAFYGFSMSYAQSLCMRALGREQGQRILASFFGPGADYYALRNKRIELMDEYVAENGVALKPGIRELLDYLHEKGIKSAITSSSPLDRIQQYLGFHGIDTAFDALCSGRDTPRGKPEPDIYLYGAQRIGLHAEECLALEDAPAGILSAWRAGCFPVMIPDLDQPDEETKGRLYARAESLLDIIDLIEAHNAHR